MTELDLLDPTPSRPIWLWTLADLALLLVGFFVLVQATDRRLLAQSLNAGFGAASAATPSLSASPAPEAMPVASAATLDFQPGSAVLPASAGMLIDWARAAAADPRVTLRVVGTTDGTPVDVDASTASAPILANDRARAVAALLARAHIAPDRLVILNGAPGRRAVTVMLSFTGQSRNRP